MARKEKKKSKNQLKSSFNIKEAIPPMLRRHLPYQLIDLIETQPTLTQEAFPMAVTKSWRVPSKCNPKPARSLIQHIIDDIKPADHHCHSLNIRFKQVRIWSWTREPHLRRNFLFLGCFHGVLMRQERLIPCYRLPSPYSAIRDLEVDDGGMRFPLWDAKDPVVFAASTLSPFIDYPYYKSNCSMIFLTGITRPAYAFYRMGQETREWIKKDSTIIDPHSSDPNERTHLLRFNNGIWYKEKFYALSLQGTLAVIEEIDSDLRITALGKKRSIPSVSCRHFKECMIESNGEILLVFLVSKDAIEVVDYVEIYQLNIDNLTWIKKESLGDLTLLLGVNGCMSVLASRIGCKRNCVYFTTFSGDGWWVYDMETAIISAPSKSLLWVDPTSED